MGYSIILSQDTRPTGRNRDNIRYSNRRRAIRLSEEHVEWLCVILCDSPSDCLLQVFLADFDAREAHEGHCKETCANHGDRHTAH